MREPEREVLGKQKHHGNVDIQKRASRGAPRKYCPAGYRRDQDDQIHSVPQNARCFEVLTSDLRLCRQSFLLGVRKNPAPSLYFRSHRASMRNGRLPLIKQRSSTPRMEQESVLET